MKAARSIKPDPAELGVAPRPSACSPTLNGIPAASAIHVPRFKNSRREFDIIGPPKTCVGNLGSVEMVGQFSASSRNFQQKNNEYEILGDEKNTLVKFWVSIYSARAQKQDH